MYSKDQQFLHSQNVNKGHITVHVHTDSHIQNPPSNCSSDIERILHTACQKAAVSLRIRRYAKL